MSSRLVRASQRRKNAGLNLLSLHRVHQSPPWRRWCGVATKESSSLSSRSRSCSSSRTEEKVKLSSRRLLLIQCHTRILSHSLSFALSESHQFSDAIQGEHSRGRDLNHSFLFAYIRGRPYLTLSLSPCLKYHRYHRHPDGNDDAKGSTAWMDIG